jgi:polyisoprenoid-binding protein YceI
MSPDFLNVAEFPEITFKSMSVERTGDKNGKVTGELTLLGVTKPVNHGCHLQQDRAEPFQQQYTYRRL